MSRVQLVFVFVYAVGMAPSAVHAQTSVYTTTSASARDTSLPRPSDSAGSTDDPPIQVSLERAELNLSAASFAQVRQVNTVMTAEAHAAVGDLGVRVAGNAFIPAGPPFAQASASGVARAASSWRDNLKLITLFLPADTPLDFTYDLTLDGDLLVSSFDAGHARVDFRIIDIGSSPQLPGSPVDPNRCAPNCWGFGIATPNEYILEQIPSSIQVTKTIRNRGSFSVGYEVRLDGTAGAIFGSSSLGFGPGLGDFTGDVSGSLHWGGIVSVKNAITGEVITDWTIESESGFDYSRPFGVPEPSSAALVSFGLLLWLSHNRCEKLLGHS